jgi:hypothetical protein
LVLILRLSLTFILNIPSFARLWDPLEARFSMMTRAMKLVLAAVALSACGGSDGPADDVFKGMAAQTLHDSMQADLQALVSNAQALQAAAPTHAWNFQDPAWPDMDAAWIGVRHAYEHVEGGTAPIYGDLDVALDGRVEDYGPDGVGSLTATSDMFGTGGMAGSHAIERILYADPTQPYADDFEPVHAQAVVAYEAGLGYVPPASFPTTGEQALEFKNVLCAKLVSRAHLAGERAAVEDRRRGDRAGRVALLAAGARRHAPQHGGHRGHLHGLLALAERAHRALPGPAHPLGLR